MNVLISRPDKIGDVILALHAAKQLKKLLPEANIYMHIAEYTRKLVENVSFVTGIVSTEESLNSIDFDVVVDLMAKYKHAAKFYNCGIKRRIGNSARIHSLLYTTSRYIRRSKALMNEAEYNWQLVSLVDPELRYSPLEESLNLNDFKEVVEYQEFSDFMVLMPSVTVSAVGWSLENWLICGRLLSKRFPEKKIIFLLGPAESKLEEEILLQNYGIENIVVRKFGNFPELLGFLNKASYYIGTSTGVTHLAAVADCPGIALYPEKLSMHPRRWVPFNSKLQVISLDRNPTPEVVANNCFQTIPDELNPLLRKKLSAFIICCDEERNIKRALKSIAWCDEIVVVDSGSKDRTLEIAKEYTDNIYHRDWTGNRDQKQFALDQCKNSWVLNIDSDEEVSMVLRSQLIEILTRKKSNAQAYNISRLIYYFDRWWDKGGWYPEYRLRFFQKEYIKWGGNDPHEKALTKGKIKKLDGHIFHYTYKNVEHQIASLQKHALMMARSLYKDGKPFRLYNVILNPIFRFFKFYILKKGYREGLVGLFVAILESYYTFLKYLVFWELKQGRNLEKKKDQ